MTATAARKQWITLHDLKEQNRAALLDEVSKYRITIRRLSDVQLWRLVLRLNRYRPATYKRSNTWLVNFVRHYLTNYDLLCYRLRRRDITGEAYTLLRNRVLDCIAVVYPFLREACWKQMEEC